MPISEKYRILNAIKKAERRISRGKEIELNTRKIERLMKIATEKGLIPLKPKNENIENFIGKEIEVIHLDEIDEVSIAEMAHTYYD